MAIKASGIIMAVSFLFALINGRMAELSVAATQGCSKAITLTMSLLGLMCLWCGLMKVAERAGALNIISRLLSPLLRPIFPSAYKSGKGVNEISSAVVANVLGVGNAATPLAINAMKALSAESEDGVASDDMVTFTVLGTAFPSIIPTTVISLRIAAGSTDPFCILPAVWISSLSLSVIAVLLSRLFRGSGRGKKHSFSKKDLP